MPGILDGLTSIPGLPVAGSTRSSHVSGLNMPKVWNVAEPFWKDQGVPVVFDADGTEIPYVSRVEFVGDDGSAVVTRFKTKANGELDVQFKRNSDGSIICDGVHHLYEPPQKITELAVVRILMRGSDSQLRPYVSA
jgi:hypothetical protein